MNDTFIMSMDKLIDRLVDMYHTDCLSAAKCCEVLDRSGVLLGYVRERYDNLRNLQPQNTTHNSRTMCPGCNNIVSVRDLKTLMQCPHCKIDYPFKGRMNNKQVQQ